MQDFDFVAQIFAHKGNAMKKLDTRSFRPCRSHRVISFAADLAARPYTKAPPVVAAMYDWSGFYIGINGGWGQSSTRYDWANFLVRSDNASGGTVGGQIGYNWQAGSWVFGLEAQGNWADLSRTYVDPFDPRWSVGTTVDALGLFTGRVGYAANNVLFYVKGGAAVASNSYWAALNYVDFINVSNTRWGAAVGVGLEWGFTRTGRSVLSTITCSWVTRTTIGPTQTGAIPTSASGRTSTWSPPASTIASAALV